MNRTARTPSLKSKLKAAKKSWTVWFASAVPVLAALAATAQEQLPGLKEYLGPWTYVAASVAISGVVAWLRVRAVEPESVAEPKELVGWTAPESWEVSKLVPSRKSRGTRAPSMVKGGPVGRPSTSDCFAFHPAQVGQSIATWGDSSSCDGGSSSSCGSSGGE